VAYNFQTGNNKIKLLMEYESVTQGVLFGNAVLAALMYGRKYDVIPQNSRESIVRTLVSRNKVRYQNSDLLLRAELSLTLRPTVSRSVCLGIKHPSGAYDQIFITCVTVTVLFFWGAFSDERTGLSFIYAAGPWQRNLSRQ
jgi:hypothetical protein